MTKPSKQGRNLNTYRASHDKTVIIPRKIHDALASLTKEYGPEGYEYETEFVKRAQVGVQDLARWRDTEEFSPYIVMAAQDMGSKRRPRIVWFATAKAAKAARGE